MCRGAFFESQRKASALVLTTVLFVALVVASISSVDPVSAQSVRNEAGDQAIDPNDLREPVDQRVLVIHDSIGLGARPQIADAFPNSEVNFLGFVGFRANVAADLLRANPSVISEHVVVQLGSNHGSGPLFARDIDRLMELLADVDHVTWLTPPRYRPEMDAITNEIFLATRRHPNLQLAPWGAFADARPHLTWDDGIHLRTEGAEAMAEMMRSHLEGDVPWNRIPLGAITGIRDGRRALTVSGWAFDPDLGKRAKVRVTVDGKLVTTQRTDRSTEGIARFLGTDTKKLGFDVRLKLADGQHTICAEVNNFDRLAPVSLGCRTLVVAHQPIGSFDRVVINGSNQIVRGWAIDPDTEGPVTIQIRANRANGKVITSGLADRNREGLEQFGKGPNHGFAIKVPANVDDYCVVARNEFAGTKNTVLGCR